ncbi:MAG TPA: CPBP family intramembrane glutamic endopeptidase [Actinomycetes bacterium]
MPAAAGRTDPPGPAKPARPAVLVAAVVLLGAANLLNNRLLPEAYVATCTLAAGLALLLARLDGCSWSELGLGRGSLRPGLRWALALAVVVLACDAVAAALPPTRAAFHDTRAAGLSGGEVLVRCLVRIPLGTALLEETGFRGVLYAMLARRYRLPVAVAVSSLLFGLWHVLPSLGLPHENAAVHRLVGSGRLGAAAAVAGAVAGTALAGVAFCELRRRSGSLLAPFALHWATGAVALLLAWKLTAAG